MPFSQAEKDAYEKYRKEEEEAELAGVRWLIGIAGIWRCCENRKCRRAGGCCDAHACRKKHADDILWWRRNVLAPYMRKRYPTVQWGVAPPDVVEAQYEAALAAEQGEEGKTRGSASAAERKIECGRRPLRGKAPPL